MTTNLGGWCGWYCQHVKNGPDGTPPGYDTDVGTCADPATPYTPSGQYVYDNTLYEDPPECTPSDPVKMLLSGIGTTTSGTEIDLEIVNTSAYVPWNANQNGLNGVWAEINVLGNEPTGFKFCFTDHVRFLPLPPSQGAVPHPLPPLVRTPGGAEHGCGAAFAVDGPVHMHKAHASLFCLLSRAGHG